MKSSSYQLEVKNEMNLWLYIVKKVVIEGCKTTNASEFKKVGESKGKFKCLMFQNLLANKACKVTQLD